MTDQNIRTRLFKTGRGWGTVIKIRRNLMMVRWDDTTGHGVAGQWVDPCEDGVTLERANLDIALWRDGKITSR